MTDQTRRSQPEQIDGRKPGARRIVPEISLADFERAAAKHLDRYPSSVAGLRAVLERRAQRSCAQHGGEPGDAQPIIETVLARCSQIGLLDDRLFGQALVKRLRNRGFSASRLRDQLLRKGVSEDLCEDLMREVGGGDLELASARIHARRRGLGPHRKPPERRSAYRERDLGALGRAGFSHEIARTVIDDPGID